MRCRMAGKHAFVQGHTRPGDALHERHRSAAVDVRVMVAVFFDDAENARRRRMTGHAGRDRPLCHTRPVAIERHLLRVDVDDELQRALRQLPKPGILLGLFRTVLMAMPGDPHAAAVAVYGRRPGARAKVLYPPRIGVGRARQSTEHCECDGGNKSRQQAAETGAATCGPC